MSRTATWGLVLVLGGLVTIAGVVGFSAATATDPAASPAPSDRPTLVGAMGQGYDGQAVLLDESGDVTWRYQPSDVVSVNSVERLNETHVLVAVQYQRGKQTRTGVRIVDRRTNAVDWNYSFATDDVMNAEVHDAEVLPDGDIVFADMTEERIIVIDRFTKAVEWSWHAKLHYDAPDDPTSRDWLHINDVDYIGNGDGSASRFLVSVRNANQLLIVEQAKGVTAVINKDTEAANDGNCRGIKQNQLVGDDPRCGNPERLNHQHNPQWLGDGAVLVADSENDRVVEYHYNETRGAWEEAWTLYRANGVPLDWPRDADRLANGNTLVTDTRNGRILEVAPNGTVVWAGSAPWQPYDADRGVGEMASPPTLNASGQSPPVRQPFETVGLMHGALQHEYTLPVWLGEWEFFATLVGVLSVLIGSVVWAVATLWELYELDRWLREVVADAR